MTSPGATPTRRRPLRPGVTPAIWGVVAAAWAIFVLPLFFGGVGFVLGAVAVRRGEPRGKWVMLAAVLCALAGLGLGLLPDSFVMN